MSLLCLFVLLISICLDSTGRTSSQPAKHQTKKSASKSNKAIGKKLTNFARKKELTLRDLRVLIKRRIPPLLKEDIRRKYMGMFANMWNAHDESLIGNFMSKYCVDDVFMVNECAHAKELSLPPRLELTGQQPIFEFWHGRMIMFPDTVFELLSTKVRSKYKPDTLECIGSVIEARIAVSGTRMFELAFEDWVPSIHQKDGSVKLLECCASSDSNSTEDSGAYKNAKFDDRGKFLPVDEDQLNDAECAERERLRQLSREWQYAQKKCQVEEQSIIPLPPLPSKPQLIDVSALPDLASVDTGSSLLDFCKITQKPQKMRMEGMMMLHVDRELRIQRFDFHGIPK